MRTRDFCAYTDKSSKNKNAGTLYIFFQKKHISRHFHFLQEKNISRRFSGTMFLDSAKIFPIAQLFHGPTSAILGPAAAGARLSGPITSDCDQTQSQDTLKHTITTKLRYCAKHKPKHRQPSIHKHHRHHNHSKHKPKTQASQVKTQASQLKTQRSQAITSITSITSITDHTGTIILPITGITTKL